MTLTNISTILRQMGAMGGCGGYGATFEQEIELGRRKSIAHYRREMATQKYIAAMIRLGRPAFAQEIADEAGVHKSGVTAHVKKYPERFKITHVKKRGFTSYLIELRNLDEVAK